jgi:hypothetical protein
MKQTTPRLVLMGVYLIAVVTIYLDLFVWRQDPPVHEKERSSSACRHVVYEFKPN